MHSRGLKFTLSPFHPSGFWGVAIAAEAKGSSLAESLVRASHIQSLPWCFKGWPVEVTGCEEDAGVATHLHPILYSCPMCFRNQGELQSFQFPRKRHIFFFKKKSSYKKQITGCLLWSEILCIICVAACEIEKMTRRSVPTCSQFATRDIQHYSHEVPVKAGKRKLPVKKHKQVGDCHRERERERAAPSGNCISQIKTHRGRCCLDVESFGWHHWCDC